VNLWQVQNLFYEQLQFPARKSPAGIPKAAHAILASDFAKLSETLLFTPKALDILLQMPAAD